MKRARQFAVQIFAGTALLAALGLTAAYAQQTKPDADPAAFARGAQAWGQICADCHELRAPNEFRDDQWKAVVTHMRIRAGFTGAQARDIVTFLQGSN
jgi:mono/diheme cytochrome c family protein